VHVQNYHISTSGLKSDITIMLLDPISYKSGNFGDSAINKGYTAYFLFQRHKTAIFLLPVVFILGVIWL